MKLFPVASTIKNAFGLALIVHVTTSPSFAESDCFPGDPAGASSNTMTSPAVASPAMPRAMPAVSDAARHDPARIESLESSFRCTACRDESIAVSSLPIAVELRATIREQVAQGMSDDQIRDAVAARYGASVTYEPAFRRVTWLLWIAPFVLLLLGFTMLARRLSIRSSEPAAALDELERRRAERRRDEDASS